MVPPPRLVECTIPVLPVRDLQRSLEFYTDQLGFTVDWVSHDSVGSVSRDACSIMLSQDLGTTCQVWVWIGLEDDSLFQLWRERGVVVLQEPTNQPWAYEMKFADPDGNVLWAGTEPRSEEAT